MTKESYQALRDPSTLLIAFVLPVVLLLLFAYAVGLKGMDWVEALMMVVAIVIGVTVLLNREDGRT